MATRSTRLWTRLALALALAIAACCASAAGVPLLAAAFGPSHGVIIADRAITPLVGTPTQPLRVDAVGVDTALAPLGAVALALALRALPLAASAPRANFLIPLRI